MNSRNFSLEEKITIFQILPISKVMYLSLLTDVPNATTNEIQNIQKNFLGAIFSIKNKSQNPQNTFNDGGLKMTILK